MILITGENDVEGPLRVAAKASQLKTKKAATRLIYVELLPMKNGVMFKVSPL